MLFQLEVERLQKQLELVRAYYGDESNEAKGAILALNQFMSGARVEDTKSAIASEDEKGDAFLRRASESLGAAKWLQGNLSQLYEEGSKEAKSLAIFEAELSAIQAALAAFAQGNKNWRPYFRRNLGSYCPLHLVRCKSLKMNCSIPLVRTTFNIIVLNRPNGRFFFLVHILPGNAAGGIGAKSKHDSLKSELL
jgi:hypothetical protein